MRIIITFAVTICLCGCISLFRTASLAEAQKSFAKQEYGLTLELASQAESAGGLSDDQRAQLCYLKAEALAKSGQTQPAQALYRYLVEHHANSEYAYLAAAKLTAVDPSNDSHR